MGARTRDGVRQHCRSNVERHEVTARRVESRMLDIVPSAPPFIRYGLGLHARGLFRSAKQLRGTLLPFLAAFSLRCLASVTAHDV